jgi:hypothetical protein
VWVEISQRPEKHGFAGTRWAGQGEAIARTDLDADTAEQPEFKARFPST